MLKTRPWVPYLYVLPALCLIGFMFAYPVAQVFNYSFRLIRGNSGPWVGFLNYELIFDDPTFRAAAKHSALLLLAVPVLLAISVIVGRPSLRASARLEGLPQRPLLSLHPGRPDRRNRRELHVHAERGRQSALGAVGIDGPDWIGDSDMALWTLMLVIIWREVGFGIVLFLARLLSLPEEHLEAARIDGAGWWSGCVT